MKKTIRLIAVAILGFMALSCTRELIEANEFVEEPVVLTPAVMNASDVTKITLDDGILNWEAIGDTVAVYQYGYYYDSTLSDKKITRNGNANLFTPSDLSEGRRQFSGSVANYVKAGGKLVTPDSTYRGQSNTLYCFYPYDRGASWNVGGSYYTKTIPSLQSGLISDFNKNLFSVAEVSNRNQIVTDGVLSFRADFKPMTPIIKFNVPASLHAVSITLSATDSTSAVVPMSGRFTVKCNRYDRASGWTAVELQDTVTVYRGGSEITGDVYLCLYPNYIINENNIKSAAKKLTFTIRNSGGGVATFTGSIPKLTQAGYVKNLGKMPAALPYKGRLTFLSQKTPTMTVVGCMDSSRYYYNVSYGTSCADPTESSTEFADSTGFEIPFTDYDQILVKVLVKREGVKDVILKGLFRNWYFALKSSIGLTVAPDTTLDAKGKIVAKESCYFAKNEERTSNGIRFKNEGSGAANVEFLRDNYISWKSNLNFYVTPMNEGAKATLFAMVGSNSTSNQRKIDVYNGSIKVGTAKSDEVGKTSSIPNILELGTVSTSNNLKFAPGGGTILSKFTILEQGETIVSVNPPDSVSVTIPSFSGIGLPTASSSAVTTFPFVYAAQNYRFYVVKTDGDNTPYFYYNSSYVYFRLLGTPSDKAAYMEFPAIPGYRLKSVNFVNNAAQNKTIYIYGDQVDDSHLICSKKIPDGTPQGDFIVDVPAAKDSGTFTKYIFRFQYSGTLKIFGLKFIYSKITEP